MPDRRLATCRESYQPDLSFQRHGAHLAYYSAALDHYLCPCGAVWTTKGTAVNIRADYTDCTEQWPAWPNLSGKHAEQNPAAGDA